MSKATKAPPRLIAVGGGKGGVGKSVVSVNLALALAQAGRKTVIVDADLGAPNLHTMLGVDRIKLTLNSLFDHAIEHLEEARVPTPYENLALIPGSAARVGAANIAHQQKLKLLRQLQTLDCDVVLVDIGAGVSFNALDMFNAADLRVVVTTPQLTAIQNAYAFVKGSVLRSLKQLACDEAQQQLLERADPSDTARMLHLLKMVRAENEGFAKALELLLSHHGLSLVGNQVFVPKDGNVLHALTRMAFDFLNVKLPLVGQLKANRAIHDSVNRRMPYLKDVRYEDTARTFEYVAQTLLAADVAALRKGRQDAEQLAATLAKDSPPPPLPSALDAYSRKHPRVPLNIEAFFDEQKVSIVDLSEGGALLQCATAPSIGAAGSLKLAKGAGAPAARVEVRNVREGHLVGVEFVERPNAVVSALKEHLEPPAAA